MPASLDEHTRTIICKVTFCSALALMGAAYQAQKIVNKNTITGKSSGTIRVVLGCIASLGLMLLASVVTTTPIILLGKAMETHRERIREVSSSINFCEADFADNPWIAEPANTASSLVSYVPLAFLGLYGSPSTEWRSKSSQNRRFALSYITLLVIGIGSTLLHALLNGVAQGGDELPMLWFMASLSFISLDVVLAGIKSKGSTLSTGTKNAAISQRTSQLQWFFGVSVLVATSVYVLCREHFLPFYIMFFTYIWITMPCIFMICFYIEWKDAAFKSTILLPLSVCTSLLAIIGIAAWVPEMLFCTKIMEQHQHQMDEYSSVFGKVANNLLPWFFNRGIHACWHCASALLAWLLIQTLIAAKGTQMGWGEAQLRWWGAPYVSFYKPKL